MKRICGRRTTCISSALRRLFERRSPDCRRPSLLARGGSGARTCIFFRRDEAEVRPEGVDLAQNELYRKVGRIQLPTLLLELDAQVHFSWKLLGREPNSAEELLGVYGALLAAGTDLEARGVATMIRRVHESAIRRYMRLFESEPALREANDALLHFARCHDIVNQWGTGFEASSDLMSLDAS